MRPIDADALLEEIEEEIEAEKSYDNFNKGVTAGLRIAIRDIKKQLTIETELDKGWISIKDRLPEPETWVMVYIKYPSPVLEMERGIQKMSSIKKVFYDGKSFYCDFGTITHWQLLPKPPKGE